MKVEIDYTKDAGAVTWVGERLLHQYWPLLAPYFRDILLPPHRHPDGNVIAWSWESGGERAISASELNAMRKRLGRELEMFADNVAREGAAASGEVRNQAALQELAGSMRQCVMELVGKRDPELARYACRTPFGVRLHSWGARAAGQPFDPDRHAPPGTPLSAGTAPPDRRRTRFAWAIGVAAAVLIGIGIWRYLQHSHPLAMAARPPAPAPASETRVNIAKGKVVGSEGQRAPSPDRRTPTLRDAPPAVGANAHPTAPSDAPSPVSSKPTAAKTPADLASDLSTQATAVDAATLAPQAKPASDEVVIGTDPSLPAKLAGMPLGRAGLPGMAAGVPDGAQAGEHRAHLPVAVTEPPQTGGDGDPHTSRESRAEDPTTARTIVTVTAVPAAPVNSRMAEMTSAPAETGMADETKNQRSERDTSPRPEEIAEVANQARAARGPIAPSMTAEDEPPVGTDGAPANAAAAVLPHRFRFRAADWHVELLADVILPTEPTRAGGMTDVESLRTAIRRQREAAKPSVLRQPDVTLGCVFVAMDRSADAGWTWRLTADSRVVATVAIGRAELRWRSTKDSARPACLLLGRGGRVISRVGFDADGAVTIDCAERITARWLVDVALGVGDQSRSGPVDLRWQTASGLPLPPPLRHGITRDSAWIQGPLGAGEGVKRFVVFDPASGWGLVSEVEVARSERLSP